MGRIAPRTYEVQAGFILGLLRLEDWVDWAVEAITAGFDSPSLRVLAGLQPPLDNHEINRLWKKVFVELDIVPLEKESSVPFYISTILHRTLEENRSQKEALETLRDLCWATNYDKRLTDFYLLYYALTDLEISEMQWYWKGANRENISKIVDDYFRDWLKNHGQSWLV